MELTRQIDSDKANLLSINILIGETNDRFCEAIELIKELNIRLCELNKDKKDYEIRIAIRERELNTLRNI